MHYDSSDKEILENDHIFKTSKHMTNSWVYTMNCKDFISQMYDHCKWVMVHFELNFY